VLEKNKYIIFHDNDAFRIVHANTKEEAIINFNEWDKESVLKNDEFAAVVYRKLSEWNIEDIVEFYGRISDTVIYGVYEVKETLYTTYEK
jgi:hypothetical protein